MTEPVCLEMIGRTMEQLLHQQGTPVVMRDAATGQELQMSPEAGGKADGLLPVFLAAGEAVWKDATGKGFGLSLTQDPAALLGYRVIGIESGPFSAIMLSVMEATAQVARPDMLLVNDLDDVWQSARARSRIAPRSGPGAGASL